MAGGARPCGVRAAACMTATVLEMTESFPLAGGARSEDGRAAPGAGA